jgi:hypothetical protein
MFQGVDEIPSAPYKPYKQKHTNVLGLRSYTDPQTNQTEITNLYEVRDENVAQDEVVRINSHYAERSIPSWVACAYYQ